MNTVAEDNERKHRLEVEETATWDAMPEYETGEEPVPMHHENIVLTGGQWEAIDEYSAVWCILSPCGHLQDVPACLKTAWASANTNLFDYILDASQRGDERAEAR